MKRLHNRDMRTILLATWMILASCSCIDAAEKRLALVVGNSAYRSVSPLANPNNDATDIAQKLKSLQFEVLLATNADHAGLLAILKEFKTKVTREHVALFFFAGHGVTVNNESFLLPVDAPNQIDLDDRGSFKGEAIHKQLVGLEAVLSPLEAAKIGIVFLDACRTSAAQPGLSLRVVSLNTNRAVPILRGTASLEIKPSPHSAGVFRAYATQLNNVAEDGTGRNSPFTKALLAHISTRGISIQELMIRVRKSVMEETASKQIPWEEAALNENFYFLPALSSNAPPPASTSSQRSRPTSSGASSSVGGSSGVGSSGSGGGTQRPAPSQAAPRLPPNISGGLGAGF